MLETEGFREQLKDINEFFTDDSGNTKRLLNPTDVGRYLNIHRTRAARLYDIAKDGISNVELARKLTKH